MPVSVLLAQRDDIGTYIVTAIFVLAWIAGIVSQMINKYRERQQERLERQGGERAIRMEAPPPVRPDVAIERARREQQRRKQAQERRQSIPPPVSTKTQAPPRTQKRPKEGSKGNRRPARVQTAVLIPPELPVRPAVPSEPVVVTEIAGTPTAARRATPVKSAPSIAALIRPQTLRQQFILTEILQKPVALRDGPV